MGILFTKPEIKIDITIYDAIHYPFISCGIIFTDWVIQKMQFKPVLQPITLLAKRLLYNHNLNVLFHGIFMLTIGGMSSYTLILLISAFLNVCPQFQTVGEYFMAFLQYYGWTFEYSRLAIAEGELFIYKDAEWDELLVIDLFKPDTNAAGGVTKFEEIRQLMQTTYKEIQKGEMKEITGIC